MSKPSLPWAGLDGPIYTPRELKPRKPYVIYTCWAMVVLLLVGGIVTRFKIALMFGALYALTLLTIKDVAITRRGLEIFYQMRITTNYNFWPWSEINAIVIEDRSHPELIALHFGRGNASKRFFFTRQDTQDILILAREKNPGVPIRQLNTPPNSGSFSRGSKGI
ncbi:hypothetical protein [Lawsonibacter sp. JLR.KK007]|uniref:hypothetical protein n=1 Tax=Lawsonibacter sp. JLR.KK007 TaxID=3114293 RepID=UPI002FEFC31C